MKKRVKTTGAEEEGKEDRENERRFVCSFHMFRHVEQFWRRASTRLYENTINCRIQEHL